MSRVTKAYRNESRRSNKEKRAIPSQRTSDCCSKSNSATEKESCGESDAESENQSSSQTFSTMGTVGEGPSGTVARKLWNAGLGESSIPSYSPSESPHGLFCKAPSEHPVHSNGRPSLRIVIPTLPISNRKVDELPNAPAISNDHCSPPWEQGQERRSES